MGIRFDREPTREILDLIEDAWKAGYVVGGASAVGTFMTETGFSKALIQATVNDFGTRCHLATLRYLAIPRQVENGEWALTMEAPELTSQGTFYTP